MDGKLSAVASWLSSFHLPLPKGKHQRGNLESPSLALRSVREIKACSAFTTSLHPFCTSPVCPRQLESLLLEAPWDGVRGALAHVWGCPPSRTQPGPHQGCGQPSACSVPPVRAVTLGRSSGNAAAFSSCLDFGLFFYTDVFVESLQKAWRGRAGFLLLTLENPIQTVAMLWPSIPSAPSPHRGQMLPQKPRLGQDGSTVHPVLALSSPMGLQKGLV